MINDLELKICCFSTFSRIFTFASMKLSPPKYKDKILDAVLVVVFFYSVFTNFSIYTVDFQVSLQDLVDTYQPPFQSCVQQGRASGIMCAYNRVNGVPNCADFNLLTNTARRQWDFHG